MYLVKYMFHTAITKEKQVNLGTENTILLLKIKHLSFNSLFLGIEWK